MSAKYKLGDRVRVLGFTEPCDFLYYNDEGTGENMDSFVGCVGEIIRVHDRGNGNYSYIISGCGQWSWVDQWIESEDEYEDSLPNIVSAEDFETVVFS